MTRRRSPFLSSPSLRWAGVSKHPHILPTSAPPRPPPHTYSQPKPPPSATHLSRPLPAESNPPSPLTRTERTAAPASSGRRRRNCSGRRGTRRDTAPKRKSSGHSGCSSRLRFRQCNSMFYGTVPTDDGTWVGWRWKSGKDSPAVEKFEKEETLTGRPIMEGSDPEMVAMPLPMCRDRSGRVASQGTSLGGGKIRSQRWLARLVLPNFGI